MEEGIPPPHLSEMAVLAEFLPREAITLL